MQGEEKKNRRKIVTTSNLASTQGSCRPLPRWLLCQAFSLLARGTVVCGDKGTESPWVLVNFVMLCFPSLSSRRRKLLLSGNSACCPHAPVSSAQEGVRRPRPGCHAQAATQENRRLCAPACVGPHEALSGPALPCLCLGAARHSGAGDLCGARRPREWQGRRWSFEWDSITTPFS